MLCFAGRSGMTEPGIFYYPGSNLPGDEEAVAPFSVMGAREVAIPF